MRLILSLTAVAAGVALAPSANAQYLMVPDSTADRVVLLDAFDGSVVNANFLDTGTPAAAAGVTSTPIEALQVGNEIWVSDQNADRIWRFDSAGGFIGDVGAGQLDNIRGMEVVGNTVYVAQEGTTAFDPGIVTIDVPSLTVTGSFGNFIGDDISYWDVLLRNGELYVSNSDSGNDAIERYALDGTFLGFFAQSDGVTDFDFIQQLANTSNGNLLGGGFSVPSGVYEFLPDGTNLGVVAGLDFGPRGVAELGNGDTLWTNGTWIRTDDDIMLEGGSFRFISSSTVPGPGGLAVLVLLGMGGRRRRAC